MAADVEAMRGRLIEVANRRIVVLSRGVCGGARHGGVVELWVFTHRRGGASQLRREHDAIA